MSTDLLYLLRFRNKLNRKGPTKTKTKFQNLDFIIVYQILMQFFLKWSSLWVIDEP